MSGWVDTMQWAVAAQRPEVGSLGARNAMATRLQRLWLEDYLGPECVISAWKGRSQDSHPEVVLG